MSPVDGLTVLKKSKQFSPDLPVIVLTAKIDDETRQQAEALGAFAYLPKPFHLPTFLHVLEQAMKDAQRG